MKSARQKWLEERKRGLGGSDAPVVLGVSPWKTPFQLWAEKTGELAAEDLSENPRVKAGQRLEDAIASWTAEDRDLVLRNDGAFKIEQHPTIPWLRATLDRRIVGEIVHPDESAKPEKAMFAPEACGVMQVKNTGWRQGESWADEVPLHVQVQVMHEMAAARLRWAYAAVLIGGWDLQSFRIEIDDSFVQVMLEKEEEFWQRVLKRDPPPVDGSVATTDAVKRLTHAVAPGRVVDLDAKFSSIDQQLVILKGTKDKIEEEERRLKNELRLAIGEAECGLLPSGVVWSAKTVQRAEYVVKATSYRDLRRKEGK